MLTAAIAVSLLLLALLWWVDPKRRRVARLSGDDQPVILRRLLVAAALLPGAALALRGDASAFFVWFGACAIGGWLIAQLGGRSGPAH